MRGLTALLCAGHFLAFVDRFLFSAVSPMLKVEFALSDRALGLLQGTAFALAYVVGSLVCTFLAKRRHSRLLVGGLLLWTAGEIGCACAVNMYGLACAQMAIGFGQALFIPSALLLIARGDHGAVGRAVSLFTASSTLGRSLAVLAAGLILSNLQAMMGLAPWRILYGIAAVGGLGLAVFLFAVRHAAALEGTAVEPESGLRRWFAAEGGAALRIVLATLPVIVLIQAVAAWMPTLCARDYGVGVPRAATLVGAVTLFTSPTGQILGGRFFDRSPFASRYPLVVMAVGMAIACAAMSAVAARPVLWITLGLLGVANVALGVTSLTGLAALQTLLPLTLRARINALFLAVVTATGFGAGPLLVGLLSDTRGATGSALAWALMIVAAYATALCAVVAIWDQALRRWGAANTWVPA